MREISSISRFCVQVATGGKVHNEDLIIALFTKDYWKDQADEGAMIGTTGL
jgi:hypothetical protein